MRLHLKCELSNEEFHDLHVKADKKLKGKNVAVDQTVLSRLLRDHGRALAILQEVNIPVDEPETRALAELEEIL